MEAFNILEGFDELSLVIWAEISENKLRDCKIMNDFRMGF